MNTEERETGYYWVKYMPDLEWEVYFWNQDDKCWYPDSLSDNEIILPLFQIIEKRILNPDEQKGKLTAEQILFKYFDTGGPMRIFKTSVLLAMEEYKGV